MDAAAWATLDRPVEDGTVATVVEGTLAALELVTEAAGRIAVTAEVAADECVEDEEGLLAAAADGTAGFGTTDDVLRCAREPGVELEVDDRVAEDAEELSAVAAPAVMMAAAVPIPSSIASAPTRPMAIE